MTDPIIPADPADPTDPVDPTDPTEPSDDESYESEPELMTCGELKVHYQNRLGHLVKLSASSVSDVALATTADLQIGKEIGLVLKHARDTRKRDFEKFSKTMTTHRYYLDRKMKDLREKKAAHTTGVPGSAIPLVGAFEEIERAVRTQRDMERAACKMLALTGVTDSHLTILDVVYLKIKNALSLKHSKGYCQKVLDVLNPFADELLVPENMIGMTPDAFKGLELVQETINQMYAMKRGRTYVWTLPLPQAWYHLWEQSVAYRKDGASEDEIKVLWYLTMRRKLPPNTLECLRELPEILTEAAEAKNTQVEATAHKRESGTTARKESQYLTKVTHPIFGIIYEPWQQRQEPTGARYTVKGATEFSRSTRFDPPKKKKRTNEQRQQLYNHAKMVLAKRCPPPRTSVSKKGKYEIFLESFYDHLDGRDHAESSTDINALAARINGESSAKGKGKKAGTSIDDPVHAGEGTSAGTRSLAQSAPIANDFLDLYYENFEKGGEHVDVEDAVIKMAEAAKHKLYDIWGWQATENDVTLLVTILMDKIIKERGSAV